MDSKRVSRVLRGKWSKVQIFFNKLFTGSNVRRVPIQTENGDPRNSMDNSSSQSDNDNSSENYYSCTSIGSQRFRRYFSKNLKNGADGHRESSTTKSNLGKGQTGNEVPGLAMEKLQEGLNGSNNKNSFAKFKPSDKGHSSITVTRRYASSEIYKNDSSPKGLVLMLNIEEFDEEELSREGSQVDFKRLLDLFRKMGYRCDEERGFCRTGKITRQECLETLEKFSAVEQHEDYDSCLIVIMSHGTGDKSFLTSDGEEIKVKEILEFMNNKGCPLLRGKPKLLIFQFCRISELDFEDRGAINTWRGSRWALRRRSDYCSTPGSSSLNVRNSRVLSIVSTCSSVFADSGCDEGAAGYFSRSPSPFVVPPMESNASSSGTQFHFPPKLSLSIDSSRVDLAQKEPSNAFDSDIFSFFSTVGGEVAYRDPQKGSLFIQAICKVFSEHADVDDLEELSKKVSLHLKEVQRDSENLGFASREQTCERTNIGFDKIFFFNPQPFNEPPEENQHEKFY